MSDDFDPYRYGPPAPPPPQHHTVSPHEARASGRQIIQASWALLRQDRAMLWLPVLSAVSGLLAGVLLFVPGYALGHAATGNARYAVYVGLILGGFALTIVGIFFQSALVIGAFARADGENPTLRGVLRGAWKLRGAVFGWAFLTATVGAVIRALEQRLGIFGRFLGFLGGVAWAVATFLAVPVLVAEGLGPIDALKRSAQLIRQTWGTSLRTTLRLGAVALVLYLPFALLAGMGVALIGEDKASLGAVLLAVGAAGLVVLGAVYSAIFGYARAMIYRYTVGRPVPGLADWQMVGAFAPKKGRRS